MDDYTPHIVGIGEVQTYAARKPARPPKDMPAPTVEKYRVQMVDLKKNSRHKGKGCVIYEFILIQ